MALSETNEDIPQGRSVYLRLLGEIRRGELPPGTRLRETDLAERLTSSRTPVREALRLLESEGLVVHRPRHGATVRSLDYAELIELYEMRAVLEGTAARLAARTASDVELAELREINAEFFAAKADQRCAYEINRQFHQMLQDTAKNRFLANSIKALEKTLMILGPTTLTHPERVVAAAGEHENILTALEARDGTRAEQEMRSHIEASQRVRFKALRLQERPLNDGWEAE